MPTDGIKSHATRFWQEPLQEPSPEFTFSLDQKELMPTRLSFLDEVPLTKSPGVNLGLSRRVTFLTRRSNSRNAALTGEEDLEAAPCIDPDPRVPNELLDEIVKFYFESAIASSMVRRDSQRIVFSRDIRPLTLVSKQIRYLILRQFCRSLRFLTLRDANDLFDYLTSVAASFNGTTVFTWVRTLSVPAFLLSRSIFVLEHLKNLQELLIDCSHCIISSQELTFSRLFASLSDKVNLISNLRSFIMTNVPRLDDSLLKAIAAALPHIVHLHLSTVEGIEMGCCRSCYEESLNRILHSPIGDIYANGEGIAKGFGPALQGFHNLEKLHLGILLSSCDLLDKHTKHGVDNNDSRPSTVKSISDCPDCVKNAEETRRCELSTSLAIADCVPSLETISWTTAFSLGSSREGKLTEENCVECDMDHRGSIQYSVVNTGHCAEDLHDGHWKIACFSIQRTNDKTRLLRIKA